MSAPEYLAKIIEAEGLPSPEREYKFHPVRKWQLDLAWPEYMLAVEVQGGIWMQTTKTGRPKGHAHPKRFLEDIEKQNEAVLAGWRLLQVTPEMIDDAQALELVSRALAMLAPDTEVQQTTDNEAPTAWTADEWHFAKTDMWGGNE